VSSTLTVEDSPLEILLKEQGTLRTPVGLFSEEHDAGLVEPEQAQFYKRLLPLSKPGEGEQYAFKVDLDKCTGCKACVSACHSLNGLDENETWRDVGTIHGVDFSGASYTQTITTACHHCADPGCLNGCPVLAYEKDEDTGIVRHLDDQCIGCQYCALKCPYDVPKYSKSLGIVRKCDMCHSRLADGEAPACAQACPTEAISITIVNTAAVSELAVGGKGFLPAAPEPGYTIPTTQYVTEKTIPENVEAADLRALRPEHAHFPLVFMLILSQLSVGSYLFSMIDPGSATSVGTRVIAFLAMVLGLGASTSHLGRPLGAWRAFLGLKRSWLSREIVVFGMFSMAAAVYTLSAFLEVIPLGIATFSAISTAVLGVGGLVTSVMIYHDTQRPFWNLRLGGAKFFGSALCLSASAYFLVATFNGASPTWAMFLMAVGLMLKLVLEGATLTNWNEQGMSPAHKSAMLQLYPLRVLLISRFTLAAIVLLLTSTLILQPMNWIMAAIVSAALLLSELLERTLFFKAVAAPKMPGGVY